MAASAAVKLSTSLEGRVAIVTGGTGGIGSAVASHLASLGAHVVIGYIGDPSLADHLLSTINANATTTPRAIAVEADVSDPVQVKALFDRAESALGKINVLVTTAAVFDDTYPTLADTSDEKWDWERQGDLPLLPGGRQPDRERRRRPNYHVQLVDGGVAEARVWSVCGDEGGGGDDDEGAGQGAERDDDNGECDSAGADDDPHVLCREDREGCGGCEEGESYGEDRVSYGCGPSGGFLGQ